MHRSTLRLCVCIIALFAAWGFPFFEVSNQNGDLYVSWNKSSSPHILAYEFEYQLLGDNVWRQLLFPQGSLQKLVVRVDQGSQISKGSFRIGYADPQAELKKTATVAFNAIGAELLAALRDLLGDTNGIEAHRCDEEFSLPESVHRIHGRNDCAYLSQGGYAWYILAYRKLPELQILETQLDGRWSGITTQVCFNFVKSWHLRAQRHLR